MKDYTEIIVVMDKSGSMLATKTDAIGGFNSFLRDQINTPGDARLSLVLFDSHGNYNMKYNGVKLDCVDELNGDSYTPSGLTALLDAIAKTIDDVGKRLSDTKESNRPSKVIFVVITDGQENDSREFTRQQVFDKISVQTNIYNWKFIYLGANQDAIVEGGRIGIFSSATYDATKYGTQSAYFVMSSTVSDYRNTGIIGNVQDRYDNATKQTKIKSNS